MSQWLSSNLRPSIIDLDGHFLAGLLVQSECHGGIGSLANLLPHLGKIHLNSSTEGSRLLGKNGFESALFYDFLYKYVTNVDVFLLLDPFNSMTEAFAM